MAKAQINYKEEAKVVIQQVPDTVTIELTIQEAEMVKCMVGHISGADIHSGREITSKVYYALKDAGVYVFQDNIGSLLKEVLG